MWLGLWVCGIITVTWHVCNLIAFIKVWRLNTIIVNKLIIITFYYSDHNTVYRPVRLVIVSCQLNSLWPVIIVLLVIVGGGGGEGGREGYRDSLCCYEALLLCSAALWIFLRKSGVAEEKKRVTHISYTAVVQQRCLLLPALVTQLTAVDGR